MPSAESLAMATQRVVVMRHGERRDAAPNAPAEDDPPLTEQGAKDVAQAAHKLKAIFGADAASKLVLVTSPFARCVQTAEALQKFGVGTDKPLLLDCALCEVFGPSRIKAAQAPALPRHILDRSLGAMPRWGESVQQAHHRFATSFLRIADRYVGSESISKRSRCSDSAHGDQGPRFVPAAVTLRAQSHPSAKPAVSPPARRSHESVPQRAVQECNLNHSPLALSDSSCTSEVFPQDIVLVTHGDALGAILSRFYPARTLYEAAFLSFLVMKRYGRDNAVFHLDDSSGANWIVDDVDREPEDPAYVQAQRTPTPSDFEDRDDPYNDPDSFVQDECDGDEDGSGVPHSSINRRVLPERKVSSRKTSASREQKIVDAPHSLRALHPKAESTKTANEGFHIFNFGASDGSAENGTVTLPATVVHPRLRRPRNQHNRAPSSGTPTAVTTQKTGKTAPVVNSGVLPTADPPSRAPQNW